MKTCFLLSILIFSLSISFYAAGQVAFYADFEPGSKEIKPNAAVNDVKNCDSTHKLKHGETSAS